MSALTRRNLLAGAGASVAIPLIGEVAPAAAQARTDSEALTSAVTLEQVAAFTYGAIADSGRLGKRTPVARLFARQETEHADALSHALQERGGEVPKPPARRAEVPGLDKVLRRDARAITTFAVALEQTAVAAYYSVQRTIEDPALLRTCASIMASEAQHLVVLREALGRNPSPDAFVTGKDQRP